MKKLLSVPSSTLAGLALLCAAGGAWAQQRSDTEAVMAANDAFDAALSRCDLNAISALWVHEDTVIALHPRARQLDKGWDAVRKSWEAACARFAELSVQMQQPTIRIHNGTALVTGVESVQGKRKNGDPVSYQAFTSNAYEKRDGRWLMTMHLTTIVPKE